MRRLTAAIALAALLALPGLAQAKYEAGGGGGNPSSPSACANQVLDVAISADDSSVDDQIMSDAWKSRYQARRTTLLEGLG